jgi:threonylcarbamoyladenosine tRNA methylthiotransferase MtaB
MAAIAEEARLMPHFHLSAQSGDNMILKRMKRRHSREDTIAFCEQVRRLRPDAAFGADLIAGFPTETDAMFENSLKIVDDAGLSTLHVFPYSSRKGTPAVRMPQLPREIVKARAVRLRDRGAQATAARLASLVGREMRVLAEKPGFGRTDCFAPAVFVGAAAPGSMLRMRIVGADTDRLIAEPLP